VDLVEGQRYEAPADNPAGWYAEAGQWLLAHKLYPVWLRVFVGQQHTDGVLESVDELPLSMGEGNFALGLTPVPNFDGPTTGVPCRDIDGIMVLGEPALDRSDEMRGQLG
jgi:hypothetical protein